MPKPGTNDAPSSSRRALLNGVLGAAVTAALPPLARAQTTSPLTVEPLSGALSLIRGAGGNVVLLEQRESATLVDSGTTEDAAALTALVQQRLRGGPITQLFNTHWHPTHTGGNDAFGGSGTTIVAHENTRLWMSTEYYVDWQDRTYSPRAPAALPTRTFFASDPQPLAVTLGDEHIEYGHLKEAHTDGDIYVLFRESNVLVAGGAVTVDAYPVIDYATGGWIGGLVDANKKLLALTDARTLIVPRRGPAQPRSHLEAQLDMLTTVRERIENLMRKGRSIAEMIDADVTKGFDAQWGTNRERFVANVYHGLWWAGRLDGSL